MLLGDAHMFGKKPPRRRPKPLFAAPRRRRVVLFRRPRRPRGPSLKSLFAPPKRRISTKRAAAPAQKIRPVAPRPPTRPAPNPQPQQRATIPPQQPFWQGVATWSTGQRIAAGVGGLVVVCVICSCLVLALQMPNTGQLQGGGCWGRDCDEHTCPNFNASPNRHGCSTDRHARTMHDA